VNESRACRHLHTQVIAKDSEAEYLECLDCGAILESGEKLETASGAAPGSVSGPLSGFDESLSDA
jgi:hypothetical protein